MISKCNILSSIYCKGLHLILDPEIILTRDSHSKVCGFHTSIGVSTTYLYRVVLENMMFHVTFNINGFITLNLAVSTTPDSLEGMSTNMFYLVSFYIEIVITIDSHTIITANVDHLIFHVYLKSIAHDLGDFITIGLDFIECSRFVIFVNPFRTSSIINLKHMSTLSFPNMIVWVFTGRLFCTLWVWFFPVSWFVSGIVNF